MSTKSFVGCTVRIPRNPATANVPRLKRFVARNVKRKGGESAVSKYTKIQLIVAVLMLLFEVVMCVIGVFQGRKIGAVLALFLAVGWGIWTGVHLLMASIEIRFYKSLEERARKGKICNGIKEENPFEEYSSHDKDEGARD